MIVGRKYSCEMKPFMDKISEWSKFSGIRDTQNYIKERKWKIKAIGGENINPAQVTFEKHNTDFIATISRSQNFILNWLPALCDYTVTTTPNEDRGTLKVKGRIFEFTIRRDENKEVFHVKGTNNAPQIVLLLRRLVYKSTYCVHCEVCEVDCPTGALQVFPEIKIDTDKCIHCHKCFNTHDRGCIAADCIRMINDMDKKANAKIKGYKTFGLKDEWLQEFSNFPNDFWGNNSLAKPQEEGFKAWLKDAEIIDAKNKLTKFGKIVVNNYTDYTQEIWEALVVNLCANSFVVNWFSEKIKPQQAYDAKFIEASIVEENPNASSNTVRNAVRALIQTINKSPLGEELHWKGNEEDKVLRRGYNNDASSIGIAYSLYKYAEQKDVKTLRVSDFYSEETEGGPFKIFGVPQQKLLDTLKEINSMSNRILVAELNMGLDSITLRDDLDALTVLEQMLN